MKNTKLWLIAHGSDIVAYVVLVLVILAALYGMSLLAVILIESRSLTLLAGGVVLAGLAIGVEVAAVQWLVGRG